MFFAILADIYREKRKEVLYHHSMEKFLPECMGFVGLNIQKYKFYSIFTRPI